MTTEQRAYKIGALAKMLHVEKFVIRFWEKEFGIAPQRSDGGQRFYTKEEVDLFKNIKHLLYEKKFTVAGARVELQKNTDATDMQLCSVIETESSTHYACSTRCEQEGVDFNPQVTASLMEFRDQLVKLRNLL